MGASRYAPSLKSLTPLNSHLHSLQRDTSTAAHVGCCRALASAGDNTTERTSGEASAGRNSPTYSSIRARPRKFSFWDQQDCPEASKDRSLNSHS